MAQNTKQDTAIAMANQAITIAGQVRDLHNTINAFLLKNTTLSPDTQWRLSATTAQNGDGSLGTPDGSPNLTHPITVGGINRAEADLLGFLTFLIETDQFISGTLPTNRAAIDRRVVIDTVAG